MTAPTRPTPVKSWHFFASHSKHRDYTPADVRSVKTALALKGYKVFFDVDDLNFISLEHLKEEISKSETFLLFLDDRTLESHWCREEVLFAVKAEVPLRVIIDIDHHQDINGLITECRRKAPEVAKHLFGADSYQAIPFSSRLSAQHAHALEKIEKSFLGVKPQNEDNNHHLEAPSGSRAANKFGHEYIPMPAEGSLEPLKSVNNGHLEWAADGIPCLLSGEPLSAYTTVFDQRNQHGTMKGALDMKTPMFEILYHSFELTKDGRIDKKFVENSDLTVNKIEFTLSPRLYFRFMKKIEEFGSSARLMLLYHGTSTRSMNKIMEEGILLSRIGEATNTMGWYGKGFSFARRAFTALYYNNKNEYLLCCLAVVKNVFIMEDDPKAKIVGESNPFNGKCAKPGYDAHLSPAGREIVIFDPIQVLPCFKLKLSHMNYEKQSSEAAAAKAAEEEAIAKAEAEAKSKAEAEVPEKKRLEEEATKQSTWTTVPKYDLSDHDVSQMPASDIEAVKKFVVDRGYSGFCVWAGTAYIKKADHELTSNDLQYMGFLSMTTFYLPTIVDEAAHQSSSRPDVDAIEDSDPEVHDDVQTLEAVQTFELHEAVEVYSSSQQRWVSASVAFVFADGAVRVIYGERQKDIPQAHCTIDVIRKVPCEASLAVPPQTQYIWTQKAAHEENIETMFGKVTAGDVVTLAQLEILKVKDVFQICYDIGCIEEVIYDNRINVTAMETTSQSTETTTQSKPTKRDIPKKASRLTLTQVRLFVLSICCLSDLSVVWGIFFLKRCFHMFAQAPERSDRLYSLLCVGTGMIAYLGTALYFGPREEYCTIERIQKLMDAAPSLFYVKRLGRSLSLTDKVGVGKGNNPQRSFTSLEPNKDDFDLCKVALKDYDLEQPWAYAMEMNAKNHTEVRLAVPIVRTFVWGSRMVLYPQKSDWRAQDFVCIFNANSAHTVTIGIYQVVLGTWLIFDIGIDTHLFFLVFFSFFCLLLSLLDIFFDLAEKLGELGELEKKRRFHARPGMNDFVDDLMEDVADALVMSPHGDVESDETKADGSMSLTEDLVLKPNVSSVIKYMGMSSKQAKQLCRAMRISDPGTMSIAFIASLTSQTVRQIASREKKLGKWIVQFWLLCSDASKFLGNYPGGAPSENLSPQGRVILNGSDKNNGFQACGLRAISHCLAYILLNETVDFKEKVLKVLKKSNIETIKVNAVEVKVGDGLFDEPLFCSTVHSNLMRAGFTNEHDELLSEVGCSMQQLLGLDNSAWNPWPNTQEGPLYSKAALKEYVKPGSHGLQYGDDDDLQVFFELVVTASPAEALGHMAAMTYDEATQYHFIPGSMVLFDLVGTGLLKESERIGHWMMVRDVKKSEAGNDIILHCIDSISKVDLDKDDEEGEPRFGGSLSDSNSNQDSEANDSNTSVVLTIDLNEEDKPGSDSNKNSEAQKKEQEKELQRNKEKGLHVEASKDSSAYTVIREHYQIRLGGITVRSREAEEPVQIHRKYMVPSDDVSGDACCMAWKDDNAWLLIPSGEDVAASPRFREIVEDELHNVERSPEKYAPSMMEKLVE